jgi:hypothetical protein
MTPQTPAAGETGATPIVGSSRELLKGTLVPLRASATPPDSNRLATYGVLRQLEVRPGETDAVVDMLRSFVSSSDDEEKLHRLSIPSDDALQFMRSMEQPIVPLIRPGLIAMAALQSKDLSLYVGALTQLRRGRAQGLQSKGQSAGEMAVALQAVNAALLARKYLTGDSLGQPLGMLNLERIEMIPSGIERGELVATIPLAPGETTAVTHKEWSVVSSEFTTIVTDSLENTSETGVTDSHDLSQSTSSQEQHSTQFNITGTVQGGIPIISGSSTAGATAQDANSASAADSIKHSSSLTQKASARSRQEHKTTISTTTVTGTAEASTRVLVNRSSTDAMRVDYFSLLRKWRVRLYRFGLRLTYDLVIPEPAAAMRTAHAKLDALRSRQSAFEFGTKFSEITNEMVDAFGNAQLVPPPPGVEVKPRYAWLAERYGITPPPYPVAPPAMYKEVHGDGDADWSYLGIDFNVPNGCQVRSLSVSALIGERDHRWPYLRVMGARPEASWLNQQILDVRDIKVVAEDGSDFMAGAQGPDQHVTFWMYQTNKPSITLKIEVELTQAAIDEWQGATFNAMQNAAQAQYFADQQEVGRLVAEVEGQLTGVDTLTLRREEGDEVMKGVVKFVLGTDFNFMPNAVHQAFVDDGVDLEHGIAFEGSSLGNLGPADWSALRQHEEVARFINQAIEWENVVTFLYSYFWDVPESWAFVRNLRHPDPTRQAFLRAGSARVVLTIRKGWEDRWLQFVETGVIDQERSSPSTGPYLSIAQEIAAYDDRNYPGIPPANPGRTATRLRDAAYTTSTDTLAPSPDPVMISVTSTEGMVVGLPVVLDQEDDRHVQEATRVTALPDATHIEVAMVTHPHGGGGSAFPVLQPGDRGALIAEWNEYTPSSGTDIAVTSNLATIA